MSEFDGLAALVTGGASGIGAATAALLHQRGAQVAVLDRHTEGAPAQALAVPGDVTDPEAVGQAVATVAGHFGGLDVVINNAGIGASSTTTASNGLTETNSTIMLANVIAVRTRLSAEVIIDTGRDGASCEACRSRS